jgi:hypothetical protein
MSGKSEKKLVERYLAEHELERVVNEVLNVCLRERPDDPFAQISALLKDKSKAGKGITGVSGRVVFDAAGEEAFEVEVRTDLCAVHACVGRGGGAQASALSRVQDGAQFLAGLDKVGKALLGKAPADLEAADRAMLGADDSEDKSAVGADTVYAASMAVCRAGAAVRSLPLHQYIGAAVGKKEFALPVPWVTAVELQHVNIGLVPLGCDSLRGAAGALQRALRELTKLHIARESALREAVDRVLGVLCALNLQDAVRLAIEVRGAGARGAIGGFSAEDAAAAAAATAAAAPGPTPEPVPAAGKVDAKASKKSDKDKKKEEADKAAAVAAAAAAASAAAAAAEATNAARDGLAAARANALSAVRALLEDEATQTAVVIAQDLFPPNDAGAMRRFVEDFGERVVLFNAVAEPGEPAPDAAGGAESKAKDEAPEGDGLPPCNGNLLVVGAPAGYICTVSELSRECEALQTQGQAVAVEWGEAHGVEDAFAADFCVAMSTGLVKLGSLKGAGNVAKLNQLLRIEHALGSNAFYAASRFRCPF